MKCDYPRPSYAPLAGLRESGDCAEKKVPPSGRCPVSADLVGALLDWRWIGNVIDLFWPLVTALFRQ